MNSETSFTPGPWELNSFSSSIYSEGECIADIWATVGKCESIDYDQAQANARLIAAAPDMYEALKDALQTLLSRGEKLGLDDQGPVMDKVRVALAKARGDV